jgi:hypothetical protein
VRLTEEAEALSKVWLSHISLRPSAEIQKMDVRIVHCILCLARTKCGHQHTRYSSEANRRRGDGQFLWSGDLRACTSNRKRSRRCLARHLLCEKVSFETRPHEEHRLFLLS